MIEQPELRGNAIAVPAAALSWSNASPGTRLILCGALALVFMVLGFMALFFMPLASAAQASATAKPIPEIIVEAPYRIERRRERQHSAIGMTTEVIELSRSIPINNLDLRLQANVEALHARIREVAENSCENLRQIYPMPPTGAAEHHRCVREAIANAKQDVDLAIALANQ